MKLVVKKKQLNILDNYVLPNSVCIKVFAIANLEKIHDQYFVRSKSFRKIYYYCKEIGIKNTVIKIISRTREKVRNEKYISLGIGTVTQSMSQAHGIGETVFFITYNHPACPERVVVHENFTSSFTLKNPSLISNNKIAWFKDIVTNEKWWSSFVAWSPYSGNPAPDLNASIIEKIQLFWKNINCNDAINVQIEPTEITTIKSSQSKKLLRKSAILFGYGNYAKTILLPNLHKGISLVAIHEIDSMQLIPLKNSIYYDTSPFLRDREQYDIYFIAGYHHTHTNLAIAGLEKNADVVVEKPIVTSRNELKGLLMAMKKSSSELYSCFQRRYHCFNDYVYQDFQIKKGDPISYYAIVYEESLPQYHWYNWPSSRSAVISNGCHWIDHFLFLNDYSGVVNFHIIKTQNKEILIFVELENKATLSLTLSHLGGSRIGMQDYIEIRSGHFMAKIVNGKSYVSENISRIIRKLQVNKYDAFKRMYRTISENIVDKNAPRLSDTIIQVQQVSSLILSLDEQLVVH